MELIVTNYDSMPLITCKKYTRPGSKVKFNIPSIGSKVKFNIPYEDILRGGGGQIAPPPIGQHQLTTWYQALMNASKFSCATHTHQ